MRFARELSQEFFKVMDSLGEFSGSLAHELNQPLTAMLANTQAAQVMLDDEEPDIEEIKEILMQMAFYGGMPVALKALRIAEDEIATWERARKDVER